MSPKRESAVPPKPPATAAAAAATAPSSSSEEDGDTSSSDSTTSHEVDEEMEEKESKESEELESESSEEEWAAAEVEKEEEEEDGELEPDLHPSSKRVDPPVPAANSQPQSNESLARGRKRASGEIGQSPPPSPGAHPKGEKTARQPKPKRIRRVWAPGDEVLILVALAQHRRQHGGELPACGNHDFFESLRERLQDNCCHHSDIKDKVRSLLRRYKSRVVPATDHDRRLQSLSKDVWGDQSSIVAATGSGAHNGGDRQSDTRSFKPLLAQEVKLLTEVHPGLENSFTRLDAKRALDIEKKLERVKFAEMKIEARMVLEVQSPKAKISKKLVSLLAKVSKNV